MSNAPVSESMLLDFDGWLNQQPPDVRGGIDDWLNATPEPERPMAKQKYASQIAVAESGKLDPADVDAHWDVMRNGIAAQNGWQAQSQDEGAFYGKMRERAQNQRDERQLVAGPDDGNSPDSLASLATAAAIIGKPASAAFIDWQRRVDGKPGFTRDRVGEYDRMARELYAAASERLAPVLDVARESFAAISGDTDLEGFSEKIMPRVNALDDRQRRDFLSAVRLVADTAPEQQRASFWSNFGKSAVRDTVNLGRGAVDSFNAFSALLTVNTAQGSPSDVLRELGEHNLESDLRRVQEQNFSPVKDVLGDFLPGWAERGLYAAPGAVTSSALVMVPVVGLPATFGAMTSQAYEQERFRLIDAGLSDHDASMKAALLAPVIAVPQAALEKLGAEAVLGRVPALKAALVKLGDKAGGGVLGYGVRVTGGALAELTTERAQDLMNPIAEAAAAALNEDMPGVVWRNGKDGVLDGWWAQTGETFVALLPLALFGAADGGSKRVQTLHGATDLQLRAFGARDEDIAGFREAVVKGPVSAAEAAEHLVAHRDGSSDGAKAATQELANAAREQAATADAALKADMREAGVARVTRDADGWKLVHDDCGETRVDSGRAAEAIVSDWMQASSQNEADALVAAVDDWHAKPGDATTKETTFTGEIVEGKNGGIVHERGGEVTRVITDAAALDALDKEARMDARGTGTEAIHVAINGANSVEFRERVADGTREMVRRLEVNRSDSAALTFLHESIESNWLAAVANGTITREDTQRAIASIAGVFDPLTARNDSEQAFRERIQRVASGQGSETELQETLSELAVANAIGRRRDDGKMPAGSITTAVDSMIRRTADPAEAKTLGGFRAFLRSAKQFFRGLLGTAAAIKKARRGGGAVEFDALIEKLTGTNEQSSFDRSQATDLQALADEHGLQYTPPTAEQEARGVAFSLSPGASVERYRKQVDAALARDPAKRDALRKKAGENLQRLQFGFETERLTWRHDKIPAVVDPRTAKQLDREQAFREAARREEIEGEVHGRYGKLLTDKTLTQLWSGPVMSQLANPASPIRGRLMSKSEAIKYRADAEGYDGIDGVPRVVFGGTLSVDEAAQELFEAGLIRDASPDTMWDAIRSEARTVARYQEFLKTAKEELKQAKNTAHEEAAEWRREADAAQRKDYSPRARALSGICGRWKPSPL